MGILKYLRSLGARLRRGKSKLDAKARLNLQPAAPEVWETPRSVLPRPPGAPARANFGTLKRRPFGRNTLRR
jgi:hypothetical protein